MSKDNIWLLIDNSNTRTKFVLFDSCLCSEVRLLPTSEIAVSSVAALLSGWKFSNVCLCSVVPWAAELIAQALCEYPLVRVCPAQTVSVDFSSYPGVATLGADRVANVAAAVACTPLPLIAVDLGTATTFDVVTAGASRPVFRGGVIAPGFSAVALSLRARTAQLPDATEWASGRVIGQNTQESMSAALRVGYPGMIDALLDAIEMELGEKVHVVLTGGDAAVVAPMLRRKCQVKPLLTLQGIALAAGLCP